MKEKLSREVMAMRAAKEFFDGAYVNLGIGIPTLAANFVPEGIRVVFHTENGAMGFGPVLDQEESGQMADIDFINAGGQYLTPNPGLSFFDSAASFAMIRGGRIDIAVLGGIEVSEKGDLANWMIPGRGVGNIGGGMDLAFNAKRVIVVMDHTAKNGRPKIVKECQAPLTAPNCVDLIITDIAVIKVTPQGLVLLERVPGWSLAEIQELTEPNLYVHELKDIML